MAYTTINKPSEYFNTKLYTGTGSSLAITGVGFQPDWVWIKSRSTAVSNVVFDVLRGVNNRLETDTTAVETFNANALTSFDTDGFTVGSGSSRWNNNALTYASWNWKANGAGVSNTSGTITSTVSANTTSGFSIVNWTGSTSTSSQTTGHGLNTTPRVVIVKNRNFVDNWFVYHASVTSTSQYLNLNSTAAVTSGSTLWGAGMTSTLVGIRPASFASTTSDNIIMYCFAEVKGFSKFGSYTGNGSADGTFVYTGFKPAWLMMKRTDTASQWRLWDNKRNTFNVADTVLLPNDSGADTTNSSQYVDLLSNGFKWRATYVDTNASGGTYIYAAFAEQPLVGTNNIPATAR